MTSRQRIAYSCMIVVWILTFFNTAHHVVENNNPRHMVKERDLSCTKGTENTMLMRYTGLNGVAYEFDIALHAPELDQVISKGIKQGLFGPKGTYPSVDELHSICEFKFAKCGKGDVLVEVGSAVGMVSLYAATRGMTVYAFDPLPPNIELLKASRCMNKLQQNLTIIWGLVGSQSDPVGKWIESEPGNLAATMRGGGRVRAKVSVVTIDETVAEQSIELLLLTCQGCELDALRGSTAHLKSIPTVVWRHHSKERSLEIARVLSGYHFFSLEDARARGGKPQPIHSITDYLSTALPAGSHPNILSVLAYAYP